MNNMPENFNVCFNIKSYCNLRSKELHEIDEIQRKDVVHDFNDEAKIDKDVETDFNLRVCPSLNKLQRFGFICVYYSYG